MIKFVLTFIPVSCTVAYLATSQLIGVGAGKYLGVQRIFARIPPNLPEYPLKEIDLQKRLLWDFGRHFFFKSKHVGPHFCSYFQKVCSHFQGFCEGFQRFCPDFYVFCQDFHQIKTFGGALTPPPPIPLSQLATSSAKIISQQIYSTEVSKIYIIDFMYMLKQGEKLGRFTRYPKHLPHESQDCTSSVRNQVFVLGYCFLLSWSLGRHLD